VAVGSSAAKITNVVTQRFFFFFGIKISLASFVNICFSSDVVSYLARHLKMIPNGNATLAELKMVRAVVSVMLDSSLSDALEILYANKVSGIALIDPDGGRVSGNLSARFVVVFVLFCYYFFFFLKIVIFSASDLRALSKDSFKDFDRSVLLYLSKSGQGIPHPRSVPETTTLAETIKILAEEKVFKIEEKNIKRLLLFFFSRFCSYIAFMLQTRTKQFAEWFLCLILFVLFTLVIITVMVITTRNEFYLSYSPC
jgi:hypothetical protein